MNQLLRAWIAVLCGSIMVGLATGDALAERRVALVVGNSHYKIQSLELSNPKNDAEDVSAVLRTLGFEVIQKINSTKRDLELAMAQFARLSTNADVALFYYAGHALQYHGQNYLMPTDSALEDEISLRYQMMAIDDVRAALERAGGVKIMILDACRNNPVVDVFKRRMSGASRNLDSVRGLARMDKTEGMVVSYATAADDVAADGTGRNSPYTAALLKRLQEPGLEIEMMFRRIASDVNAQTNGRQRPETYVSLLNEYYLNRQDKQAWDQVKNSDDPGQLGDFIRRYSSSPLAQDAQYRLQVLDRLAREKDLADRQAAQLRQEQERLAAVEKERTEREAAQRSQDEARARVAAAEKERTEREAAQRRQDEDRARVAAAEKERTEREAAQRRQDEDRARVAVAEKARAEREAAQQREDEELRIKLAAIERDRAAATNAQRLRDEEQQRQRSAVAERQRLEQEAALKVVPVAIPQEQACKRDAEKLAQLRANPDRDELIVFERDLACTKLRPQVMRLRESLGIQGDSASAVPTQPAPRVLDTNPASAPASQAMQSPAPMRPRAEPGRRGLEATAAPTIALAPAAQGEACKRDRERLAQLRASRSLDDVVRFERELACEQLRPQVSRLRESLAD